MGKKRGKSERKIGEEEQEQEPEDWCFECKDGGKLVICEHGKCGKVYHPDCVGKDDSLFASVKSWVCGWHHCFNCSKSPKFYCLGCPNAVCKKCFDASEFTIFREEKGLCSDCLELVVIIEQNLEHDLEGNKISLNDRETYEGLFKEYWEIIKVKESWTSNDVSAALRNYKKGKSFPLQGNSSDGKEEKQNDLLPWDSDEDSADKHKPIKRKKSNSQDSFRLQGNSSEGKEEKQNDSMPWDSDDEDYAGKHKPIKRKRSNSQDFVGWGSKPLFSFLESIGKYEIEPLTQWHVNSLIHDYIKEKNLHDPKDKSKFLPDEKLFPIFRKKVMSKKQIYPLLEFHFADKLDDAAGEKNDDQNKNSSTDKHLSDQTTYMGRRLSRLIGKPLLKKGDLCIKPSCFASINANNINLIYLKQSLVLELSKQPESFMDKVVGAFVRVKLDSNGCSQRKSCHLVRVIGVVYDEMFNGVLLQVSFKPKAIPISEISDDDFTEQECEDLKQKVKACLLPKLTVVELEEKAKSLQADITKHRIATRLVHLQNRIDRANLRGRNREKIALLEEREQLEQTLKQEQLLRNVPSVSPELIEEKYDPEEDRHNHQIKEEDIFCTPESTLVMMLPYYHHYSNRGAEATLKEVEAPKLVKRNRDYIVELLCSAVSMTRTPCCEKMGLKKGPWTAEEDHILISHIKRYGHGNWRALPKLAGLLRCGKSCRLRWINYLRPDIKRGKFSKEEEDTILKLHEILGNRWSAIAARLPGRTDNEIKNFWHTHLKKRIEKSEVHNAISSSYPLQGVLMTMQGVAADNASSSASSFGGKVLIASDTSRETIGNHGSSQISEEMAFWYNIFIKSGQSL